MNSAAHQVQAATPTPEWSGKPATMHTGRFTKPTSSQDFHKAFSKHWWRQLPRVTAHSMEHHRKDPSGARRM